MNDKKNSCSTINLSISENHNLLYYNIPKEIVQKLDLNENDLLEYDIRDGNFFVRKKGSRSLPLNINNSIFSGLLVERNITRNNTVLRTNLPKEVAQPLSITKGDLVEININRMVIVGRRKNLKE